MDDSDALFEFIDSLEASSMNVNSTFSEEFMNQKSQNNPTSPKTKNVRLHELLFYLQNEKRSRNRLAARRCREKRRTRVDHLEKVSALALV